MKGNHSTYRGEALSGVSPIICAIADYDLDTIAEEQMQDAELLDTQLGYRTNFKKSRHSTIFSNNHLRYLQGTFSSLHSTHISALSRLTHAMLKSPEDACHPSSYRNSTRMALHAIGLHPMDTCLPLMSENYSHPQHEGRYVAVSMSQSTLPSRSSSLYWDFPSLQRLNPHDYLRRPLGRPWIAGVDYNK